MDLAHQNSPSPSASTADMRLFSAMSAPHNGSLGAAGIQPRHHATYSHQARPRPHKADYQVADSKTGQNDLTPNVKSLCVVM